ncbi:MAG: efflux RND transporter periplasmic adaptor subunit [Proteobacteria bacterium]|nr:efflux RND transporter periplasmic adaptor subunit [Pseudomonadota bacterium]
MPASAAPHDANVKATRRPYRRTLVAIVVAVAVISALTAVVLQSQRADQPRAGRFRGGDGPVPVLAATARAADVPVYLDGVGTTRALNTVTIKPQVDGKLIEILFKEGEEVERGALLARIDPTLYQAQLDQALAKKAQDEAQLTNARTDVERYSRLAAANAINRQQADTQKALAAQLEALVQQDQAVIDNARAILAYTRITAPITGRTGIRQIDVGNIVRASDATGLVVITQIRPIAVLFTLPQQQLGRVNKALAAGPPAVEALGPDNKTVVDRGTLQVVDNQIDQTTGTIRLKAQFANVERELWPGQFVNVRLLVDTLRGAIVVPTASVQRGPNGTFVYVVSADDKAQVRPVSLALQDDAQAVVGSGLQAGERVVTSGFARLTEGGGVSVSVGGETAPGAATDGATSPRRRDATPAPATPAGEGNRRRQRPASTP